MPRILVALVCMLSLGSCGVTAVRAEETEPTPEQREVILRDRELRRINKPLGKGEQRFLYITPFGDRDQVRLRVTPYPEGAEAILWETPAAGRIRYLLPSPQKDRVLVAWVSPGPERRYTVLTLRTAAASEVKLPEGTQWVVWQDQTHLACVVLVQDPPLHPVYTYDLDTVTAQPVDVPFPETPPALGLKLLQMLQTLQPSYRNQVAIVQRMLANSELASELGADTPSEMIIRGMGIGYSRYDGGYGRPHPVAAVSPEGGLVALAPNWGKHRAMFFVLTEDAKGGKTPTAARALPLSKLVLGEGVTVSQLQWSAEGTRLLYTESHFHPARFHAPDVGSDFPGLTDWTFLVRQWDRLTGEAETILVGREAWVIPDGAGGAK